MPALIMDGASWSKPSGLQGFPVSQMEVFLLKTVLKSVLSSAYRASRWLLHLACTVDPCYARMSCIAKFGKFVPYGFDLETINVQMPPGKTLFAWHL